MTSLPRLHRGDVSYDDNRNYDGLGVTYHPIPHRIGRRSPSPVRDERYENGPRYESSPRNLASAQMKIENLMEENNQYRSKLSLKDRYVDEVKAELHDYKEKCTIQNRLIKTLQEETAMIKQRQETENEQAQEKHQTEAELRIRQCLLEKEEVQQKAEGYKEKLYSTLIKLGDALSLDIGRGSTDEAADKLVATISNLQKDHKFVVRKLEKVEETLNAQDLHTKASRETIMRLVSEIGKEQKNVSEVSGKMRSLEEELNEICLARANLKEENEILQQRLSDTDKLFQSCQEELEHYRDKSNNLLQDVEKMEVERNMCRRDYELFRNTVSKTLGNEMCEATLDENVLKDKVAELVEKEAHSNRDRLMLEEQVRDLENKIKYQTDLYQTAVYDLKEMQRSTTQTDGRLRQLENDLASGDVLNDTLRNDRNKYLRFLQDVADAMRVGETLAEMGPGFDTDVLLARANQLVKLEGEALVEKSSSNLALRKQVKTLKDQLKSKELHLEMVQKKRCDLEEKEKTRSALAIDRDDAIVSVQKLQHKLERMRQQLGDERVRCTQLKAELAETNQLRVLTLEQKNRIDELLESVGKLATTREHQKQKLGGLKQQLRATEDDADKSSSQFKLQLDAVTDDLKSTKLALDELTNREKQLLDFRSVVARMLSLDVTSLSIPDFEIISRLEALIRNHHVTQAATAGLNAPLEALDPRFVKGFEYAPRPPAYLQRPPPRRSPVYQSRSPAGSRPQSPSYRPHSPSHRPHSPSAKRY